MATILKHAVPKSEVTASLDQVRETVTGVIADIRARGDEAVRAYSEKFDKWSPDSFRLTDEEVERIVASVPQQVIDDIRFVQDQVRTFARHQLDSLREFEVETLAGVRLGQKHIPVQAAGAYIPGGRYPLTASAHMTIVTAKVAGVPRVVACTPPIHGEIPAATVAAMHLAGADEIWLLGGVQAVAAMSVGTDTMRPVNPLTASAHMTIVTAKVAGVPRVVACTPPIHGEIPAATVAAMHLAGADEIWLLGGVQAVAAMSVGTDTMRPVNLIAGPGNAYVAEAKRQLFGEIGIDLFAGPTEILVLADDEADPFVCAVDLLSQAEHGPDSPAVLITTSREVAEKTMAEVERLLPGMPTRDFAGPAWRDHGQVHVVDTLDELYALADEFAFEHVEVLTAEPRLALERMTQYGALFLGEGTCVSFGDKVIGTNHVLPTRGAARYTGGLWVGKYLKTVTYQEVTDTDSQALLGRLCGRAARVELFEGHARSGDVRAARAAGDELPWNTA
ncbi:histidinol dehydrogenase [Streptomyces sp. NBC_00986]|uniref:histidinol dehydrogenase n=1 Tax=Streptomyces sp. NBC_00986 TaxID=2903702 RepID=UPI0038663A84|nr:histidinol dehydrogenase [Streptomyces sp. NBC_00986]